MLYRIKVEPLKYNRIILEKYPEEFLVFKEEYQNMKYNDVIEYYIDSNTYHRFNIRWISHLIPNDEFKEKYILKNPKEFQNKYEDIIQKNPEEVEKYGIICLHLYYDSEKKEQNIKLKDCSFVFNYLKKYNEYLKDCQIINEEVKGRRLVEKDPSRCKITLTKKIINPIFLRKVDDGDNLLSYIFKLPFNLIKKILYGKIFLQKNGDKYIYVSFKEYCCNKSKEYLKGLEIINYLLKNYDINKEVENEEDIYRKEMLKEVYNLNILSLYLTLDEIIVPPSFVKKIGNKEIETNRIDFLFYSVLSRSLRIEKLSTMDNVPELILINEDYLLNKVSKELFDKLIKVELIDYYNFDNIFKEPNLSNLKDIL